MHQRKLVGIFLFLLPITLWGQSDTGKILVTDLLRIRSASQISMSADGKRAAYTVTSIVPDDKSIVDYQYQSQIWVVETTAGARPRQLTFGTSGASQPEWHPNGQSLAFVRSVDGKPQIFLLDLKGGEARQLTRFRYGASSPVWSPDASTIAFTSSIPLRDLVNDSLLNPQNQLPSFPLEKPGLDNRYLRKSGAASNPDGTMEEVRAYLQQNESDRKAKVIHKIQFHEEATTSATTNVSTVFLQSVEKQEPNRLSPLFHSFQNPQFIGGSGSLVIEGSMDSLRLPDRVLESAIYTIRSDGSGLRLLAGEQGMNYNSATLSSSGKWIAYLASTTSFATVPRLYYRSLEPLGTPMAVDYDRTKQGITWSEDDASLFFTSPANGAVLLHRFDRVSAKLQTLTGKDEGVGSYDTRAGKILMVKTSVKTPFEIFMSDAKGANAIQVSTLNSDWLKQKTLSMPEAHSFKNEKGQEVEYWIMKPVGFKAGKKYPLLLEIHGGPSAMWGPGESTMWHEYQYFCSKGYGVVYSNPRGSGGYGESFLRSNINDWGKGPASDVLTALDKAVAQGWADTTKLFVTGGSYAGYLVAWILGHDQRFRGACTQRGVYDLRTFFGEANAWRLVPNYFGGYPWEKTTYDILERESPINYVQHVTTPVIIFHGENDLRTGVSSSEQFYKSLKAQGKVAEYVRHPGATHEITRSGDNRQRIDQMLRTWEFFERLLGQGSLK